MFKTLSQHNTLLDDSGITSADIADTEINDMYNSYYDGNNNNKVSKLDIVLMILFLYNKSLSCNLEKGVKIFSKGLCIENKDRVIKDGYEAICQFYKFKSIPIEDLTNSNFKICESLTKGEKLRKFICCFNESSTGKQKESFSRLVKSIEDRLVIIQKVMRACYNSKNLEDFSVLCQAINPSATLVKSTIDNVWKLLQASKDKKIKPITTIMNNSHFNAMLASLSSHVSMVDFLSNKKENDKGYINMK